MATPLDSAPRGLRAAAAAAAAVVAVGALAYAPSLGVPFVFDDVPSLVEHPRVHMVRLDGPSLARAIEGFPLNRWLAYLSFALNHLAGGLAPGGYHAVNLAFHLAAAIVAGLLALEVLARALPGQSVEARARISLVTALLFAVHPVQTQAVTYVVQRMTSMGGCFALLSLWLFLRGRRVGAARPAVWMAGAVVAAFAAASCKESYLVLPGLAALLEFLLIPGLADRVRRHALPMAAAAAGVVALGLLALRSYSGYAASAHAQMGIPAADRLLTQGRVLVHYLSLLALPLPSRLHVDYAWLPSTSPISPATTLPALGAVVALVVAAVVLRRRHVLFTLAVTWFLVALAVEQSVLPIDLVFEHRLYLPSFGWLLLAAAGLERLGVMGVPRAAVAVPLVAALAAGTWQRNVAWRDPVSLFADEAANGPGHARGLVIAAGFLEGRGRHAEAEGFLARALALEPGDAGTMANLGVVAAARGDASAADRWFRLALEANRGGDPGILMRHGAFLLDQGRYAEAAAAFERAIAAEPGMAWGHLNLAQALTATGRFADARERYDAAMEIDPSLALAYYGRAWLERAERGPEAALADARRAVELDPQAPLFRAFLGEILAELGRPGPDGVALPP